MSEPVKIERKKNLLFNERKNVPRTKLLSKVTSLPSYSDEVGFFSVQTGKCIRRFAGIYAYCWYFIDRMW